MRTEVVRPLDGRPAIDALSRFDGEKQCDDCTKAESLMALYGLSWAQARAALHDGGGLPRSARGAQPFHSGRLQGRGPAPAEPGGAFVCEVRPFGGFYAEE